MRVEVEEIANAAAREVLREQFELGIAIAQHNGIECAKAVMGWRWRAVRVHLSAFREGMRRAARAVVIAKRMEREQRKGPHDGR